MAWPLPAEPPLNASPERTEEYLREMQEVLAARMGDEAGRLAREAVVAYADAMTAAVGDPAVFDAAEVAWRGFITQEVGSYVAGIHLNGAMVAFFRTPGLDGIIDDVAEAWLTVVNEGAVTYQATATNRIVQASASTWSDVRSKTVTALSEGLSNEELKESIEAVTGYSEYRAATIGRTETMQAYNAGDLAGAKGLGEYGPHEKVWIAALDARTRVEHAEADGQTVGINEMFVVMGEQIERPGEGSAANVVNCRCVMEFLYPGDARPDGSVVPETPEVSLD